MSSNDESEIRLDAVEHAIEISMADELTELQIVTLAEQGPPGKDGIGSETEFNTDLTLLYSIAKL